MILELLEENPDPVPGKIKSMNDAIRARMHADLPMLRRVFLLALPLILSNLTQPLLTTVDTVLSGHLPSAAALGGVAMGGIFFNAIFWSFGFLRMGTTGLVSQAHGAGNEPQLATHVARALLLALALGLAVLLLQKPLLTLAMHLLSGSEAARAQALIYCRIRIFSAPAALVNYVVLGTLLGRQRARVALLIQGFIQVTNAVVALALVVGLHWAIAGIATATLAAECAGALLGLLMLARSFDRRLIGWSELLHRAELKRLFALNRDILLRTLSLVAAYGWFTRTGAQTSDTILAANAVLLNVMAIASYGLDGFANATEALVGEAIGARQSASFRAIVRTSTLCALTTALVFALLFASLGSRILPLLTSQPAVIEAARADLGWLAALPLVAVWGFQLDGIFIGATRAHDLRNSMLISFTGYLLVSLILVPRMGNAGLWLSFHLFMALRGLTLAVRLKGLEQECFSLK